VALDLHITFPHKHSQIIAWQLHCRGYEMGQPIPLDMGNASPNSRYSLHAHRQRSSDKPYEAAWEIHAIMQEPWFDKEAMSLRIEYGTGYANYFPPMKESVYGRSMFRL